jgi:uncharacterized membrane protein
MTYHQLALVHLWTVVPAFFIGTYLLVRRKGTPLHRMLGRVYMALMLVTAIATLFMPANVGARLLNHFGFIHIFSVIALLNIPSAYLAARRHDLKSHRANMISLYIGGLIIAGGFAVASPGRIMHDLLFGAPQAATSALPSRLR